MRILYTDELESSSLSQRDKLFLYNGLDALITREVFDQIHPLLDSTTSITYRFMLALQAPILEMQIRGCLVDHHARNDMILLLNSQISRIENILNHYAKATWGEPLNARSWQQKGMYLYDFAKCREITKFDHKKHVSKRTTERAAIEKLGKKYPKVLPITNCILAIMDLSKQRGTLKAGIDPDGYFRASFGIAGTETGRLNSKKNIFGRGSNFQNIAAYLRVIFVASEGPIPNRNSYNIPKEYI